MKSRRATAVVLAVAALAGAGCGSGSGGGSSPAASAIGTDLNRKPAIPKPTGPVPTTLQVRDVVKGQGAEAKIGSAVTVQYVGASYATGKQFDASWDRGAPFTFQLGAGMVIPGWDKGVAGMRVGGRRELIIPPELGYGAQGAPPDIAPGETLVFVIDAKKVS